MQSKLKRVRNIMAMLLLGLVFSLVSHRANAQYDFSLVHSFTGHANLDDGADPQAPLTFDSQGNLYGTTQNGGIYGAGTVFKIDTQGNLSLLRSFSGSDGTYPKAGVTFDSLGNLYGTTKFGGTYGSGTVFKIDTLGNFIVIHTFNYNSSADGAVPTGSVTFDSHGNLYGTTYEGGTYNSGTVFKIDAQGNFSLLHSFNGSSPSDGAYPKASVTLDSQGNLYGTTYQGGAFYNGSVFKIDVQGNFSQLHSFSGSDGCRPTGSVTSDSQGNLYGTTTYGGASGVGTIFKIGAQGNFSVLHSFSGSDGAYPLAAVTLDSQGNLYGTTYQGGANGGGNVFKTDAQGNFLLLHNFKVEDSLACSSPQAAVTLDSQGNIYGTTSGSGASGDGTVFELANNIAAPTVSYTYHGFVHRPRTSTIFQQVTVANTSGVALTGPFNLVISGLPSGITLNNATGTAAFTNPGSPYLTVGGSSLAAGASITVTLSFNDPHLSYVAYSPTFLAGNGTP